MFLLVVTIIRCISTLEKHIILFVNYLCFTYEMYKFENSCSKYTLYATLCYFRIYEHFMFENFWFWKIYLNRFEQQLLTGSKGLKSLDIEYVLKRFNWSYWTFPDIYSDAITKPIKKFGNLYSTRWIWLVKFTKHRSFISRSFHLMFIILT